MEPSPHKPADPRYRNAMCEGRRHDTSMRGNTDTTAHGNAHTSRASIGGSAMRRRHVCIPSLTVQPLNSRSNRIVAQDTSLLEEHSVGGGAR
jgi:hypothetical protein